MNAIRKGMLCAGWEIDGVVVEAGRKHMGMQELEDSGALVSLSLQAYRQNRSF